MTRSSSIADASKAYTNEGSGKNKCNYNKLKSMDRAYA